VSKEWTITPHDYLDADQVKRLRSVARERAEHAKRTGAWMAIRDHTLIEVALGSGMRASELSNLKVEDVILERNSPSIIVKRGKGGKTRVIKISEALRRHLEEYIQLRSRMPLASLPFLFLGQRGQWTRNGIGRAAKQLMALAGLPSRFSVHSLRHSYATHLLKACRNLRLVQMMLGHSSPTITTVYAQVMDSEASEAANNLFQEPPEPEPEQTF